MKYDFFYYIVREFLAIALYLLAARPALYLSGQLWLGLAQWVKGRKRLESLVRRLTGPDSGFVDSVAAFVFALSLVIAGVVLLITAIIIFSIK